MNDSNRPATQVRFTLRTAFVICTLAAIFIGLGRRTPELLVFMSFVGLAIVANIVLNMMGVYPKE